MMPTPSDDQRKTLFTEVPDWALQSDRDTIQKTFTLIDSNTAFGFMTRMVIKTKQMNHYPE